MDTHLVEWSAMVEECLDIPFSERMHWIQEKLKSGPSEVTVASVLSNEIEEFKLLEKTLKMQALIDLQNSIELNITGKNVMNENVTGS